MDSYNIYDHKSISFSFFTSFNQKIVDLKEIVRITNVFYDAKTVKIVKMVTFVPKEDVFRQLATKTVIADRATTAFLKNVSLDVDAKEIVQMAKIVLMTIVSFHQVIICVI